MVSTLQYEEHTKPWSIECKELQISKKTAKLCSSLESWNTTDLQRKKYTKMFPGNQITLWFKIKLEISQIRGIGRTVFSYIYTVKGNLYIYIYISERGVAHTLSIQFRLIHFIWRTFHLIASWWSHKIWGSKYNTCVKIQEGKVSSKAFIISLYYNLTLFIHK